MSEIVRESGSPEETFAIAASLASSAEGGSSFYLEGDLGAGKTLFTKGLASSFGVDPSLVTSPTFALVNRYSGGVWTIYHLDLYRIDSERELAELGIEEMERERAVLVVEWAEKLGRYRLRDAILVTIEVTGERTRRITIRSPGERETRKA